MWSSFRRTAAGEGAKSAVRRRSDVLLGACRRRRRRGGVQLYQLWAAWGATGQLSGIWLGLWVSASGGAAQSASMFIILIMASMGRSGRNAPLCCSHGREFSPTFACLPPSHSPGLQWPIARKSSPRRKRRSHARTWLVRSSLSRTVSNASSDWNRPCYRVA